MSNLAQRIELLQQANEKWGLALRAKPIEEFRTRMAEANALIAEAAALARAGAADAPGHVDCCLSETNSCNWPACGCEEPQPPRAGAA